MTRTSVLARVLPIGLAAVIVLVMALGTLLDKEKRMRADTVALLATAEALRPRAMLELADRAVAASPRLTHAHALRALALARLGRVDDAEPELALAGDGRDAQRARAWILFRRGKVDEAFALLRGVNDDGLRADLEWLEAASDRPVTRHVPPVEEAKRGPYFLGRTFPDLAPIEGDPGEAIEPEPGTIEAHAWSLEEARADCLALEDMAADKHIENALLAPPRERDLAERARLDIARIRQGSEGGPVSDAPSRWHGDLALFDSAVSSSERDIERDRILHEPWTADRAVTRLRRALALFPGDARATALLARAIARTLTRDKTPDQASRRSSLKSVASTLFQMKEPAAHVEAARAQIALGDMDAARASVASVSSETGGRVATEIKILVAHDGEAAAAHLGLTSASKDDLLACEHVLRSRVLERTWDSWAAIALLARRGAKITHLEHAEASASADPVGSLAAIELAVRDHSCEDPRAFVHDFLASRLPESISANDLTRRGLGAEEARDALAILGEARRR